MPAEPITAIQGIPAVQGIPAIQGIKLVHSPHGVRLQGLLSLLGASGP
jgi:hypothetical protein